MFVCNYTIAMNAILNHAFNLIPYITKVVAPEFEGVVSPNDWIIILFDSSRVSTHFWEKISGILCGIWIFLSFLLAVLQCAETQLTKWDSKIIILSSWFQFFSEFPSPDSFMFRPVHFCLRIRFDQNNNFLKIHLSTAHLSSSEKISVRYVRYNATHKSLQSGRILPPFRWDGPDQLPIEIRSPHDTTYELFLSLRTVKSLHFRSDVRKVPGWSYKVVIIAQRVILP